MRLLMFEKLRLQLALNQTRTLLLAATTDKNSFNRMVDGRGRSAGDAKSYLRNVNRAITDAQSRYPITCRFLRQLINNIEQQFYTKEQ